MIFLWQDLQPRAGWEQMALDRALLDRAAEDGTVVLRCYRWSSDTISFGANESALRHWQRDSLERDRIPVVRRPSGGRAVWHSAEDLTYAVTAPLELFGGQLAAYQFIHARMAGALSGAGLATSLAAAPERLPGLQAGSCFDVAVGGEVLISQRKTIGSAQLVIGSALLQHGEIARCDRRAALAPYARIAMDLPEAAFPADLPPSDALAEWIAAAWYAEGAQSIGAELMHAANRAALSYHAHFRDPQWSWRR